MPKKKIVLVILSLNFPQFTKKNQLLWDESGGGAENQILLWAKTLNKTNKFRIYIISKRRSLKEHSKIKVNNLSVKRIFSPNKFFLIYFMIRTLLTVLHINQKERVHLIHVNPPPLSLILSYIINKLIKIPTFYKIPSIFSKSLFTSNYYLISQPFFLNVTKRIDKIQCISSQIFKAAQDIGFKPHQLITVPNGIDITPYSAISRNSNEKILKLIFIGRFVREKGIILLIKAFNEVIRTHPDISLSLYGRGPERKRIAQLINELHLQEKILISSFSSENEKLKILKIHHLFILPSFFEGLSNALLEALCSGMPALVSDIQANREIIKDNHNGLLFKKGNVNSLKNKILYCLDNYESVWKLGIKGRELCIKNFALKHVEKHLFNAYNVLIKPEGIAN